MTVEADRVRVESRLAARQIDCPACPGVLGPWGWARRRGVLGLAGVLRPRRAEELRIDGEFHPRFGDDPLLLTVTKTRGKYSHTDVSFWFVLAADQNMRIEADPREANEIRWFALDDPTEWAPDRFDPHMARFRDKLLARLRTPTPAG